MMSIQVNKSRELVLKQVEVYLIRLLIALISIVLAGWASIAYADKNKGQAIAEEMKAREKGFGHYSVDMKMELISASNKKTIRKLHVITREVAADGDQFLAVFDSPADVKGTGFLTHTHINKDDYQWLYLPSLKRVKRISPRNKKSPFMGSEFSYEDLTSYEVGNYTYKYVGDEKLDMVDCYILDRFPTNANSGYQRQRVWIEKERYLALKIYYYNKKAIKIKTLEAGKFKKHLSKFWFAHEMKMQNHQSGKVSVLYWQNFKFNAPLHAAAFDPNSLRRIR